MKHILSLIIAMLITFPVVSQTALASQNLLIEAEKGELSGGAKIMTDHRGYSGKGFVASFERIGASVRVSLEVPVPGTTKLSLRYSSGFGFQTVGIYVDGQKATDLRLVGTTGWDEWATATASLQLSSGKRSIEIRRDRNDSGTINIDWLSFTMPQGSAPQPKAKAVPDLYEGSHTEYEAENGILGGTAKIAFDHMDFSGKGFVAGFESANASVRLSILINSNQPATASIRYSAGWGDQTVQLYIDGHKVADSNFPGTPNWDVWSSVDIPLSLAQGTHEFEIRRDSKETGVINIDKITVSGGEVANDKSILASSVSIEAEECVLSGSAKVDTDHSDFRGTGFVAGFGNLGAAIGFNIEAMQSGTKTIHIRYSAGFGDETVGLYVDGQKTADLRCIKTTNWDHWADISVTMQMSGGKHSIEIRRDRPDTGLINIDSILWR